MSLLERCPHFRGWYVQASVELGPKHVSYLRALCTSLNEFGTSNGSFLTAMKRHSMVSGDDPAELAEEDQDDEEIPLLPPDKDPTTHQTNPLIGRTPVKNKRLVSIYSIEACTYHPLK